MKNFKEKSEVSHHLVKVWKFIKSSNSWVTNKEISVAVEFSERTVRSHTLYLVNAGLIDQMEMFPAHRYKISELANKRNKVFFERLNTVEQVFDSLA